MNIAKTLTSLPPTLLELSVRGTGPFVVFCPDVGGNMLYARPLIRALGQGPVIYGLRLAPDMLETLSTLTIEQVARRFAVDLIASGIGRPLHIVGFSFAGYMAAETARQLTLLGEPPDRLWILDVGPRPRITLGGLVHYARTRSSPRRAQILHWPGFIRIDISRHPEGMRPILRHFYKLFSRYRPGRWSVTTTVVVARDSIDSRQSPDLGWGRHITSDIDCLTVPGDHLGMMREVENAAVLAALFHDQFRKDTASRGEYLQGHALGSG